MTTFVFDIETVPDLKAGRKLLELDNLSDDEALKAMQLWRKNATGHDFMPHFLHQVVCISIVMHHQNQFKVWSLGEIDADEAEIIRRFFDGIDRYSPLLVSWNGSGFDLPVLHYRALHHHISAPRYFEVGDTDNSFKWNNYINRFHYRHTDLMDVLAGYQMRANAKLDQVAAMLGFPGKMGQSGAAVAQQYLNGDIESIRDYCETDVLNTFLVFLRFEKIRGHINADEYQNTCNQLCEYLEQQDKSHFNQFLAAWPDHKSHTEVTG